MVRSCGAILERLPPERLGSYLNAYVAATVVDHIVPHQGDPRMMLDRTSWQSHCKRLHDAKSGSDASAHRGKG